jgi:hypothetical protein
MGWSNLEKSQSPNYVKHNITDGKFRRKRQLVEVYTGIKPDNFKPLRPYAHQRKAEQMYTQSNYIFDMSDAGTGKTFAHLRAWHKRRQEGGGKLLVFCPKSIQFAAWANDVMKFFPEEYTVSVCGAKQKEKGFVPEAQIVVVNHDGVKWLAKCKSLKTLLADFDTVIVDESEAFKNHTSQRSKAMSFVTPLFKYRTVMTATPFNKSVTELWHQVYLLDQGNLLGKSFFKFRSAIAIPEQVGPRPEMRVWVDKPGAEQEIATLMSSFTIRNEFEKCLDIPPNVVRRVPFHLNPSHMVDYETMRDEALIEATEGDVTAVNAAVQANKLLQIASGSVYTEDGERVLIDTDRYELIKELVSERDFSVVFFQWRHQKELLMQQFDKEGISYEVIDGTVPDGRRKDIVEKYQAGHYQTLLLHPKSAGHGLTLTRGKTTIWASPIYQPSLFKQANHRIYRAGQTERTETLMIEAVGTLEEKVNHVLEQRLDKMLGLLELLA